MSFTQKVDVLDLIIRTLKEHEKELDGLTDRLDKAVSIIERLALR